VQTTDHGLGSWRPDASLLSALDAAVLVVDRDAKVRFANAAACDILGSSIESLLGADVPSTLFAEAEAGAITEVLDQVISIPREWTGELPLRRSDRTPLTAVLTCTPMWAGRKVTGAVLMVEPHSDKVREAARGHRYGDRLTRLARVSGELLLAADMDAVTKVTVEHTAEAAGATVASLSLLVDEDTLALVGMHGGTVGVASRWATYPVSAQTPAGDCLRAGTTLVLRGREEIRTRYPHLEHAAEGERSMVCLPLRGARRILGVFTMTFPGRRAFEPNELEFFGILADACAQAIDRVSATEEATDQRAKLRFLADASAELASSLDYETTLARVAELAVPWFADWCSIQLAEDGDLRTLVVAHADPEKVSLARELQRRYPADPDAPRGAYHVLRTGQSEIIPDVPDELLVEATQDAEHLRLARELNLRSAISVPLVARGRTLGVITWVAGDAGRRFGPADLQFAEDLGRRAAVAIDNAGLHSETREAAIRLQRAVLPERLPEPSGWELAALYHPAGRTEVGGDFYDVIALDDQSLALFVGDVMGRGVGAAAAMSQMRSAIRANVAVDPAPAAVLAHLDLLFEQFQIAQLVTLVYAVLDRATDEMVLINAGHPPPLVLRADGTVDQLPEADGPPLGVPTPVRRAAVVALRAGDTLLAFSDGLIERRTEDIDAGIARLRGVLPDLAGPGLVDRLAALVEQVRDHERDDDVAALAVRRHDDP
jgi:PAS domain S-box-containing protein